MDPIFKEDTQKILLNGAVYHAKCFDVFKNSNFKRAEKAYALLQFYREYLDVEDVLKNFRKLDAERLVPNEKKVLHPADRVVLSL